MWVLADANKRVTKLMKSYNHHQLKLNRTIKRSFSSRKNYTSNLKVCYYEGSLLSKCFLHISTIVMRFDLFPANIVEIFFQKQSSRNLSSCCGYKLSAWWCTRCPRQNTTIYLPTKNPLMLKSTFRSMKNS